MEFNELMEELDYHFHCPTCQTRLKPLRSNPKLGFLCYGCPAIITVFPDWTCVVKEVWTGREWTCRYDELQHDKAGFPARE